MIGIAALLHKTKDAVKRQEMEKSLKERKCTKCGIYMAETYTENVPWLLSVTTRPPP